MTGEVPDLLRRIVDRRRERLAGLPAGGEGDWGGGGRTWRAEPLSPAESPFLDAIRRQSGRAVIAEIKMGSPRLGSLVGRVDPVAQAAAYREAGAAALSVVVEPDHFHGSYELLTECRAASGLPALAKDFVVSERQLAWAREAGADAVLLIAALYEAQELVRLAGVARGLGLVPLVECHATADLELLAGADWELVGVNNRDLRSFEVDLERSIALVPRLPAGALRVAESGISSGDDRRRLAKAGFDAFLVGEALLLAEDPAAALRELVA